MRDYQQALDNLRQRFGFDFVALSLVPAGEYPVLTWQYASGNLNNRYQRIVLAPGLGILGLVYKTGRPLLYTDVNRIISREELVHYPIIIGEGLASLCAVPLWDGAAISAIMLAAFRHVSGMTQELLDRLLASLSEGFEGLTVQRESITVQADSYWTGKNQSENQSDNQSDNRRPNGNQAFGSQTFDNQTDDNYLSTAQPQDYRSIDHRPVYDLMTHRILEAQEAERKRISRELHDGVVQELLGIQMLLRQTRYLEDSAQKDGLIVEATSRTNHILDEVRRIAVEQRPASLDTLGLSATLSEYTKRQSATFGVNINFKDGVGATRYQPAVETVVYRVCQEAVVNACKYSEVDDIAVSLREDNNNLVLSVQDYGNGFDQGKIADNSGGLGLNGMKERAELVEGRLEINSKIGGGTMIKLTVPCTARHNAAQAVHSSTFLDTPLDIHLERKADD